MNNHRERLLKIIAKRDQSKSETKLEIMERLAKQSDQETRDMILELMRLKMMVNADVLPEFISMLLGIGISEFDVVVTEWLLSQNKDSSFFVGGDEDVRD